MALADMPYNFEEVVFVETQRICAAPCFQGEQHLQPTGVTEKKSSETRA